MQVVVAVYSLTEKYPQEELYGLTSQTRRSAVSIPSNIAEGRSRGTRKDFIHFLHIAYGSSAELQTQLEIAKRLLKTKDLGSDTVDTLLVEGMKMLNTMLKRLKAKS